PPCDGSARVGLVLKLVVVTHEPNRAVQHGSPFVRAPTGASHARCLSSPAARFHHNCSHRTTTAAAVHRTPFHLSPASLFKPRPRETSTSSQISLPFESAFTSSRAGQEQKFFGFSVVMASKVSVLLLAFLLVAVACFPMVMGGGVPGGGNLKPWECSGKCSSRCGNTQYKKACLTFCNKCCAKCLCVPPGYYGNKGACPCYNNWKTKEEAPSAPRSVSLRRPAVLRSCLARQDLLLTRDLFFVHCSPSSTTY
ncbi:hypothetical protein EJB05_45294, partial [Eragrostis curvula]